MSREGIVTVLPLRLPEAPCALCGAPAPTGLCGGCGADLPFLGAACACCALPLAAGAGGLCGRCRTRPPPYHRTLAPFQYEPPVDYLVHGMKFGGRLDYARLLGELLASYIQRQGRDRPGLLLPVPLHPRRLRERGYNPALEIARPADG